MKKLSLQLLSSLALMVFAITACTDHLTPEEPSQFTEPQVIVNGLVNPMGITTDGKGNIFVSEIGTGKDDATVSIIFPNGLKKKIVSGLGSKKGPEGGPEGISHILYKNGWLYILHGIDGKLFIADVSKFGENSSEIPLSSLKVSEYGQEIRKMTISKDTNSNLYDMTFGPDDHLYMVDAGANAVFKRDKDSGKITEFAVLPQIGMDEKTDPVPTGIVFDGTQFLISTLSGGPFFAGTAKIFAVGLDRKISVYAEKFTTLTSIVLTANNKPIATKYADFSFSPPGFVENTGAIVDEKGNVLLGNLNMPSDIKRIGDKEYLIVSMKNGTISKVSF